MKKILRLLLIALLLSVFAAAPGFSAGKTDFPTTPKTNKGKKWRIGYLEGGPYANYPINLKALIHAFAELGWVEPVKFPPEKDEKDTTRLWPWISKNVKSKYITFVRNAYWSNDWDAKVRRPKSKKEILRRLNKKKDIDLMIAMGTWAGQDLATNEHSVPTIVMSTSDPIKSNIIKSAKDSGFDHVNARVDPTRYERQVRIFHDIFGFKKLGVVYDHHTVEGRTYAAVDDVEKVAKELGFEIVSCHVPWTMEDREKLKNDVVKCHKELAPKVDAFYITVHRGVTRAKMDKLMAPLNKHKVPSFSQRGTEEVKYGALLSIARAGFKYIAMFHAETIAKIFNGAKPRDLEQVFEDPPRIAINLKAAQNIGFDPPVDILGAADEIYEEIAVAE